MKLSSSESALIAEQITSDNLLSSNASATNSVLESRRTSDLILPDKPIVSIEPRRSWVNLDLRGLWAYRELLYFLTWRDVKVRYKQTVLGAGWAILQPLLTMIVFSLLFGRLAGIKSDGLPYPLFAFAGLLPWTFFANAIANSGGSLIADQRLITKVYFPRMVIPAASVCAGVIDLMFGFLLLLPLMLYFGVALTWNFLMVPVLVLLTMLLALGTGMFLSAINVKYRDVRYALPFVIQIWFFLSPIIYPSSIVPERWRWLYALNPMTGIIEGYRTALLGGRGFNWSALAAAALVTFGILVYAAYSFRRMESGFADLV